MSDSLAWSASLLHSLYKSGVRHAIISPGSRSTPLTLAAAIHAGIKKQVVLDERSAGFIALGIGKSTGVPAVLICTSGTAVSNYMPAVIEAKESGVPMILLTADRPPNLRNLGSSQTVDQIKLFGDQVVFFHEAGEPVDNPQDVKRIEYAAKQAVTFSIETGGAAHLNLPFRKPLEPTSVDYQKEKQRLDEIPLSETHEAGVNRSTIHLIDQISELISSSERPLIIAGPANPHQALLDQIHEISNYLNTPVFAEPGSTVHGIDNQFYRFDTFLRDPKTRNKLKPDVIIRFGDQPYSSSLLWALEEWSEIPVIHITARKPTQDHSMSVSHKIICKKYDSINLENIRTNSPKSWIDKFRLLDQKLSKQLNEKLSDQKNLTDGLLFHHFASQLSDHWNVMLSNSLPARDMLTFGTSKRHQFVNRGAAGIDGVLSTALGIHVSSNRPTCCFIGDLALLHDSNALYTMQRLNERPFIVIVINNSGGSIFQMLPIYRDKDRSVPHDIYETYFQTPQKTDISHLAKASNINFKKIKTVDELNSFEIKNVKGAVIIECITDSKASMEQRINILKQ